MEFTPIKKNKVKILICIVTHDAEQHIKDVLYRLPKPVWDSTNYHILLCDDYSKDGTLKIAQETLRRLGNNHTLLKMVCNQGYGGSQKVCFRFAIQNDYDFVVLFQGNGKYAPELVLEFIQLWNDSSADIILGSRMMGLKKSKENHIPLYKYLGNKIVTRIQNYLCNYSVTEFHTGYRAYTTKFLKSVPFELNSDGIEFNTEMLIQGFHFNAKIKEASILVNFVKQRLDAPNLWFVKKALFASVRFYLQRMGLLTSLKFPHSSHQIYRDKTDDPNSTHSKVCDYLSKQIDVYKSLILDIGCGQGYIAREMAKYEAKITGVDLYHPKTASFHEFIQIDLNKDTWTIDISAFNTVLLLDIIEHLTEPEKFLLSLRSKMEGTGTPKVIVSTPNIGFVMVRLNLLFGRFNYTDRGILDVSHKRFFTISSFKSLLIDTGYDIEEIKGIGVPFQTLGKGIFFRFLGSVSAFLAKVYPPLFAFQLLAIIRPKLNTYKLIELGK